MEENKALSALVTSAKEQEGILGPTRPSSVIYPSPEEEEEKGGLTPARYASADCSTIKGEEKEGIGLYIRASRVSDLLDTRG